MSKGNQEAELRSERVGITSKVSENITFQAKSQLQQFVENWRYSRYPKLMRTITGLLGDASIVNLPIFIYALVDPRDKTVRYIGQTNNPERRKEQHRAEGGTASIPVKMWRRELRSLGFDLEMHILAKSTRDHANNAERYWIEFYSDIGTLYNNQEGGILRKTKHRVRRLW